MSDPKNTPDLPGLGFSRIKVQGDSISGQQNRVWIDDHLTSNVTSLNIRVDAEGVNEATIGLLLLDGLDVDSAAKVRVDEPTHELLVSLGWGPPEESKR